MRARDDDTDPELKPLCDGDPLARKLAYLQPAPAGLNRDRLLYAAGEASRERTIRFWKLVCGGQVGLAVAIFLGFSMWGKPPAGPQEFAAPAKPAAVVPQGYANVPDAGDGSDVARGLRLRNNVANAGLGVLPTQAAPPVVADPAQLENSLKLPPGVLAVPQRPREDR